MRNNSDRAVPSSKRPKTAVAWVAAAAVALIIPAASLAGFQMKNPLNDRSLHARVGIWSDFLKKDLTLFGAGPGTAGSAAADRATGSLFDTHVDSQVVVDNYYVTTLTQYGLVGLGCLIVMLFAVCPKTAPFGSETD